MAWTIYFHSSNLIAGLMYQYLWKLVMLVVSTSHQSFQQVSTNLCFSNIICFLQNIFPFMRKIFRGTFYFFSISLLFLEHIYLSWRTSIYEKKLPLSYNLLLYTFFHEYAGDLRIIILKEEEKDTMPKNKHTHTPWINLEHTDTPIQRHPNTTYTTHQHTHSKKSSPLARVKQSSNLLGTCKNQ